jgi:Na+/H+ antiporter NhaD/arsenite permease-like protein
MSKCLPLILICLGMILLLASLLFPAPTLGGAGGPDESMAPEGGQGGQIVQAPKRLGTAPGTIPEKHGKAAFWAAAIILLLFYIAMATEWLHRSLAAMLAGALVLFVSYTLGTFNRDFFILSFDEAMRAVDLNVIFLLLGMMIFVGVLKKTGAFHWLAYRAFALSQGRVFTLSAMLMLITAVASAFLDNVTTMLLIIPVTLEIADDLKVNPLTLLIPEVFASNVGGTATLIGDPPNLLIGSQAHLTFLDFTANLAEIVGLCLIFTVAYYLYWYRQAYRQVEAGQEIRLASLREGSRITDKKLLVQCLVLLAFTILLFVVQGVLHMEPSIAALVGSSLLLAISGVDVVQMLHDEVEWPTLTFFIGLFIVVAGVERTGLLRLVAELVRDLSHGSLPMAILLVLWVSALASAVIDNIPFTMAMLPIVASLKETIPGAEGGVLFWALALGACMGGNATLVGASANVVTAGLAAREGCPITFKDYLKACLVPTLITLLFCSVYLLLEY